MTPFTTAFSSAFSLALLHFVWQGAAVAVLLSITLFALRRATARTRYAASCAALAMLALLPVITTSWLYTPAPAHAVKAVLALVDSAAVGAEFGDPARSKEILASIQQWALPAWSIGVLLFALRLLWGCRQVSVLRRSGAPAEENGAVVQTVARLAARLGIDRPVRVLISSLAGVPSVVGWRRPVILLPAAARGSLLHRIERMLGVPSEEYRPSKLTGLVVLAIALGVAALNVSPVRAQEPAQRAVGWAIQERADSGVKVDLRGAEVLHVTAAEYPKAAAEAGISGTVTVEATVDAHGNVSDARVISGPMELRKAALQSVLQWHFTNVAAGATRQVGVMFEPGPVELNFKPRLRVEPRGEPRSEP